MNIQPIQHLLDGGKLTKDQLGDLIDALETAVTAVERQLEDLSPAITKFESENKEAPSELIALKDELETKKKAWEELSLTFLEMLN